MKIAVSVDTPEPGARVSFSFGRTSYFAICSTEKDEILFIKNPFSNVFGGAGIQAAQLLISHNIDLVVTGKIGKNAMRFLSFAGIRVVSRVEATVIECSEYFNQLETFENSDNYEKLYNTLHTKY